ncbi:Unknown protein, partial [Striga hermonthica]
ILVGSNKGNLPYGETIIRAVQLESCQALHVPASSAQPIQPISSVPPGSSSSKRKSDFHRDNQKGKRGENDRRSECLVAQGQNSKCPKCGRYHPGDCHFTQR